MKMHRKTHKKKQQPRPEVLSAEVLSPEEIKERRETEQFNRCMKMMKVYCPNRGMYFNY